MERHLDVPGVHLKLTLEITADFPGMTGAQFIELMDRCYRLDSLDMGDAAGACLKAYMTDDFPIENIDGDMVFDWTGTPEPEQNTLLREEYPGEYTIVPDSVKVR